MSQCAAMISRPLRSRHIRTVDRAARRGDDQRQLLRLRRQQDGTTIDADRTRRHRTDTRRHRRSPADAVPTPSTDDTDGADTEARRPRHSAEFEPIAPGPVRRRRADDHDHRRRSQSAADGRRLVPGRRRRRRCRRTSTRSFPAPYYESPTAVSAPPPTSPPTGRSRSSCTRTAAAGIRFIDFGLHRDDRQQRLHRRGRRSHGQHGARTSDQHRDRVRRHRARTARWTSPAVIDDDDRTRRAPRRPGSSPTSIRSSIAVSPATPFGGFTAYAMASGYANGSGSFAADPRVDAIIPLAPATGDGGGRLLTDEISPSITIPSLVHRRERTTRRPRRPERRPAVGAHATATPRYRGDLVDAQHQAFTDICEYQETVSLLPDVAGADRRDDRRVRIGGLHARRHADRPRARVDQHVCRRVPRLDLPRRHDDRPGHHRHPRRHRSFRSSSPRHRS